MPGQPAQADAAQAAIGRGHQAGDRDANRGLQWLEAAALISADQQLAGLAGQDQRAIGQPGAGGKSHLDASVDWLPMVALVAGPIGVTPQAEGQEFTAGTGLQSKKTAF